MEKKWDRSDKVFILLFTVLSCIILVFIARDFAQIVTDIWYGFGNVIMEFGRVVEQLPV